MPVSRSPTSSQERAIPMSSEAARTLPITSIGASVCGVMMELMPAPISTPKTPSSSTISAELTPDPAPRGRVGQDGPHPAQGEQQTAGADHDGRIPDLVVRHQSEEGDRQGISERQKRRPRPDLPDDVRLLPGARPWGHRQGHEQQAGQRARRPGDGHEHIPVCPSHHEPSAYWVTGAPAGGQLSRSVRSTLNQTPSRHAPSRQPMPRTTPSRVNPAFSRARCSARLSASVAASIRCTGAVRE